MTTFGESLISKGEADGVVFVKKVVCGILTEQRHPQTMLQT